MVLSVVWDLPLVSVVVVLCPPPFPPPLPPSDSVTVTVTVQYRSLLPHSPGFVGRGMGAGAVSVMMTVQRPPPLLPPPLLPLLATLLLLSSPLPSLLSTLPKVPRSHYSTYVSILYILRWKAKPKTWIREGISYPIAVRDSIITPALVLPPRAAAIIIAIQPIRRSTQWLRDICLGICDLPTQRLPTATVLIVKPEQVAQDLGNICRTESWEGKIPGNEDCGGLGRDLDSG